MGLIVIPLNNYVLNTTELAGAVLGGRVLRFLETPYL
jgi:hypothetical protein